MLTRVKDNKELLEDSRGSQPSGSKSNGDRDTEIYVKNA